jgi:hypothetical protein
MSAMDEFAAVLEETEVMKQAHRSLREEPAHLLGDVCAEFIRTERPVPDHRLHYTGYLGEASLRSLVMSGLIKQEPGKYSLYAFEPTDAGQKQYKKLKAEGFYDKKVRN